MRRFFFPFGLIFCLLLGTFRPGFADESPAQKKHLIIFVLGAPGAGPSDLAVRTAQKHNLSIISAASLLQFYLNEEGTLGDEVRESFNSNGFITDSLLITMLTAFIQQNPDQPGYVLQAFPRTIEQTKILYESLQTHFTILAFSVNLSDSVLIDRYIGRVVCKNCGRVYHTESAPPEVPGVCDQCENALFVRGEDQPEKVRGRVQEYHARVTPMIDYIKRLSGLVEIDGNKYVGEHFLEGILKEMDGVIDRYLACE